MSGEPPVTVTDPDTLALAAVVREVLDRLLQEDLATAVAAMEMSAAIIAYALIEAGLETPRSALRTSVRNVRIFIDELPDTLKGVMPRLVVQRVDAP